MNSTCSALSAHFRTSAGDQLLCHLALLSSRIPIFQAKYIYQCHITAVIDISNERHRKWIDGDRRKKKRYLAYSKFYYPLSKSG